MRAAVIHEHGGLDRLAVEEFPEPVLGPGDVLVEVKACALNYLDIFTRRGMPGIKVPMPMITGGDIAGAVSEVGAQVEGWSRGDRVLVYPIARGRGMYGETIPGGLCERIAVPADLLMRIPDAVSFERAAALPVAYGTALRMLVTRGKVSAGERVLVLYERQRAWAPARCRSPRCLGPRSWPAPALRPRPIACGVSAPIT